jgi:hypothetical protein
MRNHAGLALKKSDIEQFGGYSITFRVGILLFDVAVQLSLAAGRKQSISMAPRGFDEH